MEQQKYKSPPPTESIMCGEYVIYFWCKPSNVYGKNDYWTFSIRKTYEWNGEKKKTDKFGEWDAITLVQAVCAASDWIRKKKKGQGAAQVMQQGGFQPQAEQVGFSTDRRTEDDDIPF